MSEILELFLEKHSDHIHVLKNGNYYHFNPITGLSLEFNKNIDDRDFFEYSKEANLQLKTYDKFKKDLEI